MDVKLKIFISSVQSEFAKERKALAAYIRSDAMLGDFFEVFLFEEQPAQSRSAQAVYLDEVEGCDIYFGLFGAKYGSRDAQGVSPTEREYDRATELNKTRFAFVKSVPKREKKEETFIRVNFTVGAHDGPTAAAPTHSEFPRDAIREAVVNAVCHRDYTSNDCVQVMLFRDRLEIINPGPLPRGLTVEDLYRAHDSIPRNRLIARAMSWTSYVEKSGSGTGVIVDKCVEQGLTRPDFDPTVGFFKTVIWREGTKSAPSRGTQSAPSRGTKSKGLVTGPSQGPSRRGLVAGAESRGPSRGTKSRDQVKGPSRGPKSGQAQGPLSVFEHVLRVCAKPMAAREIMKAQGRTNLTKFRRSVLAIMVVDGVLELTIPDKPNSRLQKYRLTAKGRALAAKKAKRSAT